MKPKGIKISNTIKQTPFHILSYGQYKTLMDLYMDNNDPEIDEFVQFVYKFSNCKYMIHGSSSNSLLIFKNEQDKLMFLMKI